MKKIMCVLLILLILLSFFACSKEESGIISEKNIDDVIESDKTLNSIPNTYSSFPSSPSAGEIKLTSLANTIIEKYPEYEIYFIVGVTHGEEFNRDELTDLWSCDSFERNKLINDEYLITCKAAESNPKYYSWNVLEELIINIKNIDDAVNTTNYKALSNLYSNFCRRYYKTVSESIGEHNKNPKNDSINYLKKYGFEVVFEPYDTKWNYMRLIIQDSSSRIKMINGRMDYVVKAKGIDVIELIKDFRNTSPYGMIFYLADSGGRYISSVKLDVNGNWNITTDLCFFDRSLSQEAVHFLNTP